jgi:Protein of unknown function (DUF2490)
MKYILILVTALQLLSSNSFSQKKTEHNTYTWVSINSTIFLNKHWFIMADVHARENNFFVSNSFIFGRVGIGYQVDTKFSFAAGYGNLLLSPSTAGWTTKADEHRIYQQVQLSSEYKKIKLLQRLRNEQRWQQVIVNDKKNGDTKFSNRVRYLLNATVPVFKNKKLPQLVVADEMLLQFGKDIVNNTFDQNRVFFGIKQSITPGLSFDAGYMNTFQQKSNGSSYVKGDVLRLFFYYTFRTK